MILGIRAGYLPALLQLDKMVGSPSLRNRLRVARFSPLCKRRGEMSCILKGIAKDAPPSPFAGKGAGGMGL